jgi:hypothetical protein
MLQNNHLHKAKKNSKEQRKKDIKKPFLGHQSVVGKNTLWTSKLGSDLHADFDRKEMTF